MLSKLALLLALAPLAPAQPAPAFDVASVKVLTTSTGPKVDLKPTSLELSNVTLGYCIRWANNLPPLATYLTSGPEWIDPPRAQFYTILAKTEHPARPEEMRAMLRTLLAQRFQLTLHRENKSRTVNVVSAGSTKPKMKRSNEDDPEGQVKPIDPLSFNMIGFTMPHLMQFVNSMAWLPSDDARPFLDDTGLDGAYDFKLDLQRYRSMTAPADQQETGRVDMEYLIARALESLGFRVTVKKAPVETLVIDHVERQPADPQWP